MYPSPPYDLFDEDSRSDSFIYKNSINYRFFIIEKGKIVLSTRNKHRVRTFLKQRGESNLAHKEIQARLPELLEKYNLTLIKIGER